MLIACGHTLLHFLLWKWCFAEENFVGHFFITVINKPLIFPVCDLKSSHPQLSYDASLVMIGDVKQKLFPIKFVITHE